MRVTIIGAGNMGRAIAMRAVAGGNEVEIIDRNPEDAQSLAGELGDTATALDAGAPFGGDLVVLALYYASIPEAIAQYGDRLDGRAIVDISVPLDWDTMDGFVVPADSSGGEEVQKLLPDGSPVVKAFCTTFARTLVTGEKNGIPLDVPMAGDDEGAKQQVASLVEGGGMRPIDLGPLRRARQLEHAAFLQIAAQNPLGAGFDTALKIL
ncbi:MAG TPA: NADPH-dependent F420 reductase, partial [Gaiellaceae bacterium]